MRQLLYIDLFCGAGGTSTGVNSARIDGQECAKVIACVNHDANAIASHAANHPDALHFTEDIRTLELSGLLAHVNECKIQNPDSLIVLWASLECTNFSKAKGGQPRDPDSRTLAEHLFRYIAALNPDYVQIENVEEFMSWGDVDDNGRPLSKDRGRSYVRWVNKVKRFGYDFEHRILNAADYGAYTSRKRFFGIFARYGLPIAFPEPTHCKQGNKGLFDDLLPWKAVKDVLDLSNEGKSIFDREKPLSEKTLERIYAGLIKFVAEGKTVFLSKQFSGHPASKNISVDAPAGTITARDHHMFISAHYGNGYNIKVNRPAPTLTTKDKLSIVKLCFLDNQYGNGRPTSIDTVSGCITTNPKQKIVTICPWILNPQFASSGSSIDTPCFTLIARMDKRPPYLITPIAGEMMIRIKDTDSPMTVKIKEFMALYGIADIKMRMLTVTELKLISGFPEDYVLFGTVADQKKFIGNAVEVTIARKLCEALCISIQLDSKKCIA